MYRVRRPERSFLSSLFYRFPQFFCFFFFFLLGASRVSTTNLVVLSPPLSLGQRVSIKEISARRVNDRKLLALWDQLISSFRDVSKLRTFLNASFGFSRSRFALEGAFRVSVRRDIEDPGSARGREREREFYVSLVLSSPGTHNARRYVSPRYT